MTEEHIRILTVDDEALAAMDMTANLTHLGYEVCGHAHSGAGAILMAEALRPDLMLMDIGLGGAIDGIDAAWEIKARLGIDVVFISAHTDALTLNRARQVRALGFVPKPYSVESLAATLEEALQRREREHPH